MRGSVLARLSRMGILSKLFGTGMTTDVLEILASQHAEVDTLFEQIENGNGNRRTLFTRLADLLAAHATIEEKIFYPAVMAKETEKILHESVEEHLSLKRLLADLIELRVESDEFASKLKVLKEQVTHHAHEEEEKELFPKVKSMLDDDQRAALGNEIVVMFQDLMQSHPYKNVPSEIDAAAELPAVR
jgi:hemerythrin superfamily protein